jgi:hypothetical protein
MIKNSTKFYEKYLKVSFLLKACSGCTVVEHLPTNPKVKCSCLATATGTRHQFYQHVYVRLLHAKDKKAACF